MQKDIISTEADAWFLRNRDGQQEFIHLNQIIRFIKKDQKVLEIGCSFGYNLNHIMSMTGCLAYGLEPSQLAIEYGTEIYPDVKFQHGIITEADKLKENFDHVIIGFCLYLVEKEILPEVIYRIDKILNKGGFLHIVDFDAKYPLVRDYTHDKRFKVHKMDYGQIFTAFPNYFLAEKNSWGHSGGPFHTDPNERCSTITLFKKL